MSTRSNRAKGTNLIVTPPLASLAQGGQRAAGHASLTTTECYLHLVDRMMEEQMERNAL